MSATAPCSGQQEIDRNRMFGMLTPASSSLGLIFRRLFAAIGLSGRIDVRRGDVRAIRSILS
jgi:hypothetical protein